MKNHALLNALLAEQAKGNVFMSGSLDSYVVFKYSKTCVIDNAWNDTTRKARGIVFHAPTADIVCRPFDKFFNLDEKEETRLENLPKESFIIWEKLDGSCCSAFLYNGAVRCSTPGSYESPQAEWATKWLNEHLDELGEYPRKMFTELLEQTTVVFECLWSEKSGNPSPGVVNYGTREELTLLTIRDHDGHEWSTIKIDEFAETFGFNRPRRISADVLDRKLADKIPTNEEGYVVQFIPSNVRVKIKSEEYMRLHKYREVITEKGICELMEGGESRRWLTSLPKHLAESADDIIARLNQRYFKIFYEVEDIYKKALDLPSRREQALYIQQNLDKKFWGICFNMLDNKFSDRILWKLLGQILKEERKNEVVSSD
jgi:RNA ligase